MRNTHTNAHGGFFDGYYIPSEPRPEIEWIYNKEQKKNNYRSLDVERGSFFAVLYGGISGSVIYSSFLISIKFGIFMAAVASPPVLLAIVFAIGAISAWLYARKSIDKNSKLAM